MFKKALQVTITFALLVGAYQGYVLGFATVSSRLTRGRPRTQVAVFVQTQSKTAKIASRLAEESFGKGHWAANQDLGWRVYDAERGYFLYYQNYERLDSGKRVKLWPFAIIWNAKDGKSRKTALSKEAIVDLSEPLGILKPNSSALRVLHAKLIGDVRMRDDKGTIADPTDDLFVGPITQIEYDEPSARIFTDSDMEIRDRNLVATSRGLVIDLRKNEGASTAGTPGFEAKTATLLANVHILVKNVGASGILPGTAKSGKSGRPTPLDARCDSSLRIDFPEKVPAINSRLVGPPQIEGPTFARLTRNVVVIRGSEEPDQLNSDNLRLTLIPMERKRAPMSSAQLASVGCGASVAPFSRSLAGDTTGSLPTGDGPLTELTLTEAVADGHAVWLQSKAQGIVARCNQLIYKKLAPLAPDETYLGADAGKQLFVEKLDAIDPTKPTAPRSITTIFAADAKIFDDGKGGQASTVIARGPGKYENRPARDKAIARSATWQDELTIRTDAADNNGPGHRRLTLNGQPKLVDHEKGMTLVARRSVVASLRPRAEGPDKKGDKKDAAGTSDASQLEWIQAKENVVLTSPGKTLTARDQLDATFQDDPNPVVAVRPEPPANSIASPFGPVIATKPAADKAKPTTEVAAKVDDKTKKPSDLPVVVRANRVWAKIRQKATGDAPEILEAMLRGGVLFHQDAAPGKARGMDVTGEAVDVVNQGDGLMKFKNYWVDPSANSGTTRLAKNGKPEPIPLAQIITDERYIEGQVIGLDQKADYAWAKGAGKVIQLVEPGMLNEKGFDAKKGPDGTTERLLVDAGAATKSGDKSRPRVPFTIKWSEEMRFFGQSKDPKQNPSAKAEFRGDVQAWLEDAIISCQELDTYTDKPIKLDKAVNPLKPGAAPPRTVKLGSDDLTLTDEAEKPQLAFMDARGPRVVIVYAKRDPITRAILDKQFIEGKHITYDKTTGEFESVGTGLIYLWRHRKLAPKEQAEFARGVAARKVSTNDKDREREWAIIQAEAALGPWEAIKISFTERMKGRFGMGKDRDQGEPRIADFYGQVKTIVAGVATPDSGLNFDRRPADYKFLTADSMRVVEMPPEADAPKGTAASHFLTALGNGQASDQTHTIAGDLISFDSDKQLFHVYGENGREVVILDQKYPGQAFSNARGQAAKYNHATGAAELINPSSIAFVDGEGSRPTAVKPGIEGPQAGRRPRPPLRPPPLGNMERRGFSGR